MVVWKIRNKITNNFSENYFNKRYVSLWNDIGETWYSEKEVREYLDKVKEETKKLPYDSDIYKYSEIVQIKMVEITRKDI